jgi:hypothetical protein
VLTTAVEAEPASIPQPHAPLLSALRLLRPQVSTLAMVVCCVIQGLHVVDIDCLYMAQLEGCMHAFNQCIAVFTHHVHMPL